MIEFQLLTNVQNSFRYKKENIIQMNFHSFLTIHCTLVFAIGLPGKHTFAYRLSLSPAYYFYTHNGALFAAVVGLLFLNDKQCRTVRFNALN